MTDFDNFDNLTEFFGLPVENYDNAAGLAKAPSHAYRIAGSWDDDDMNAKFMTRLSGLLTAPEIGNVTALVFGNWGESGVSPQPIIDALVTNAGKLKSLRAVFFGDIAQEESEISWIEQGDHGALISALEGLELYVVRGGNSLRFTGASSGSLRELVVQSGGLGTKTIESILSSSLPAMRHLELWLGEDGYGFDGSVDTVKPLITGEAFPALSYLGLRNSEIVDEIAAAFNGSSRFGTLSTLDLSNGTLTDEGASALLSNPGIETLDRLDLHHHFMTAEVSKKFAALDAEVDVSDVQEDEGDEDEPFRFVAVSE